MKFTYLIMLMFIVTTLAKKKNKKKGKKIYKKNEFTYDLSHIEPFDPHAASGNSNFYKEMHKMDINYFQIKVKMDFDTSDNNRLLESMKQYFEKWFAINPQTENLLVAFMKSLSGQQMLNRFEILYSNRDTEFTKKYYVDVDYQDGKNPVTPYNQDIQMPLDDDVMEDPWKKKYGYTLDKECNFIKEQFDALEATCVNVINDFNYVLPTVYDVTLRDKKNKQFKERVVVVGAQEIGQIGEPQDNDSGVLIEQTFKNSLREKIYKEIVDGADNLPDKYKNELMQNPSIQKQINDLVTDIKSGSFLVEDQIRQSERDYQEALRKQLFVTRMEVVSSYNDHLKTLFLMQDKSDDINAFNIKIQIRKILKKSNYLHSRKIHDKRNLYIYEELRYKELQRKLMDMEYVEDELKDKYYRKMTKIKASNQLLQCNFIITISFKNQNILLYYFISLQNFQFKQLNNMKQQLNSKFIILKKLGKGTFSNVYKVQKISSKKFYALKRIVTKKLNQKELSSALNEIRILASFQNQHLIGFKEAFIDQDSQDLCIIMDYCSGGDLKVQIKKMAEKNERFTEKKVIKFFFQLTQALQLLHQNSIVHRDIKSANVMIDKKLKNVKIGDMNVSTIVKSMFAYTQTGTPFYASPEVWREDPYNSKADIWSLGCLMFEICMHKTPFQASNINILNDKIQNRNMEKFDDFYSQQLQQCILKLLNVNQHLRPSAEEILNFDIFNKFEKNNINNNSLLDTIRSNYKFNNIMYNFPDSQYSDDEHNQDKEFILNFKKQSASRKTSIHKNLKHYQSQKKIILKQKTTSTKESLDDLINNQRYQKIFNGCIPRKSQNKSTKNYLAHILPHNNRKNNLALQINELKSKVLNNSQRIQSYLKSNYQQKCNSQKMILKQKFININNESQQNKINSHISFLNYDVSNQNINKQKQRSFSRKNIQKKYDIKNTNQYITYDQRNQLVDYNQQKEKIELIKKLISQKNQELKRKCSYQNLSSKKVKDLVQFLKKNQLQKQHYVFNQFKIFIYFQNLSHSSSIHIHPYLSSDTLKIMLLSQSDISTQFIDSL